VFDFGGYQVAHGQEWTSQIRGSSQVTVRIPSVRGEIKDRNGMSLVQNAPAMR
jgi:Cell division protein FtsI/penicillin-binding protein 2